jgi:hypothetical protein
MEFLMSLVESHRYLLQPRGIRGRLARRDYSAQTTTGRKP